VALLDAAWVWPIVRARQLHAHTQMQYQWRFFMPSTIAGNGYDTDMSILSQEVSFPGIDVDKETFNIGQLELYRLGMVRRGGSVTATFLEVEGNYVDRYFRDWFEEIDSTQKTHTTKGPVVSRARAPIYKFARQADVQMILKNSARGPMFRLKKLLPVKIQSYSSLNYEGMGPLKVSVEMVCNEVERID
jgi:hypothetical protein